MLSAACLFVKNALPLLGEPDFIIEPSLVRVPRGGPRARLDDPAGDRADVRCVLVPPYFWEHHDAPRDGLDAVDAPPAVEDGPGRELGEREAVRQLGGLPGGGEPVELRVMEEESRLARAVHELRS